MGMVQDKSVSASLIRRADLPEEGIVALDVEIGGELESIIVYCQGPRLAAWFNVCPHQGRRLDYAPGKFLLDQGRLVCAAHGATFRLQDGECIGGPCRGSSLRQLSVLVDAGGELVFGLPA
jgi:nitrite reductase/ring-hydroxylating ferredoxin subunit